MKPSKTFPLLLATLLLGSCNNQSDTAERAAIEYSKPTPVEWAHFKRLHIVFGHQSVGANLLAGVRALAQEQNVDLPIADSALTERDVVIRQFPIGKNGDPVSKLDAFRAALQQGAGAYANVAQMKFCFVDVTPDIDVKALAATYIEQTAALSAQYPGIVFVVTTSPLTTIQTGPKAWIKRLLGRLPAGYLENLRRHEFNQILRAHYNSDQRGNDKNGSRQTLFDLAAIESLHGSSAFEFNHQSIEALAPAISSDGGHLNELGQHVIAAAWIHHLSTLKLQANDNAISTARQ